MPDEDIILEDQELDTGEDTTSQNEDEDEQPQDEQLDPQTLLSQKNHWRKKAVDEKTGKTYKELYEEATKPEEQPKPEAPKDEPNDDVIRTRLEVRGFLDAEEQDIIIKASKALGMTPLEAAQDEIVKGRINQLREQKKTQNAVPPPGGRAGAKNTHTVDYYIEKNIVPDDPEMAEKVQNEIARRSRAGA